MREIVFRAKCADNGEWVKGVPHFENNKCFMITDLLIYEEYQCTGVENVEVIPETIGQYTGLQDNKGKMVFEGDVVNDEQSGYNYSIKWFSEYGCFALANKNGHVEFGCDELEIFLNDLVVVGNIHDNPELLKGV